MFLSDRGRLRVTSRPGGAFKPLLPVDQDNDECRGDDDTPCFKAGKKRYTFRRISWLCVVT